MVRKRIERKKINNIIPIARPYISKKDKLAVGKVLCSGWFAQGPEVKKFEDNFASYVGSKYACAVSSCTAALHLALISARVKAGDVVITVSHSFIATANSIRYCQAEPVFIDIDPSTFNMSVSHLKEFIDNDCEIIGGQLYYKKVRSIITEGSPLKYFVSNDKVKLGRIAAIMPVHQMGLPCDLKAILRIAQEFNIPVVEDAACAIGSQIKIGSKWEKIGKPHADIACFSFHPRKIITTGEGGMLTTNNQKYDKFFRLLRQHGMSISDRARHASNKVIFEGYLTTGYNYRMTDIQAALGIGQLERLPAIVNERRRIADIYCKELKDVSWLQLPAEPEYCRANRQSFPVRVKDGSHLNRNIIMQYLLDAGISTRRGIMNAHQEKAYDSRISLINSEVARDSVILLPIFNGMKKEKLYKIIKIIRNA